MSKNLKKFFIIAGEPSGDLHGAALIKEIRKCEPNSSFIGHGGISMKNEGMEIIKDIDELSIMGFFEVLKHLPKMYKIMIITIDAITQLKPDRIILIDYPGFNLRLAKKIEHLQIPITYFILPQAWAWKENRVGLMKKFIDQSISIFPFEKDWFSSRGVNVQYFGHPFIDQQHVNETTRSFYLRHNLNKQEPILILLPGSRQQEVDRHWAIFLQTVEQMKITMPNLQVLVGKSHNVSLKPIPSYYKIEENARKAILSGTAALVCSGTATLECAIESIPLVVCYKLNPISWIIAKAMTKIKYTAMVNLIANDSVVAECLQSDMNSSTLANELLPLLNLESEERKKMLPKLESVKKDLGSPGVYGRVATAILERTKFK
ncbi:lipid-A-disaccharide synthase [bacterium]|nr:MAG: lipid-A-disaccharide synthase [bacterium]